MSEHDQITWTNWNELAKVIHSDNVAKGFWPEVIGDRNVGELLALIHSEISEAAAASLNDSQDDKLTHLSAFDVEIGDAMIRTLDFTAAHGIDVDGLLQQARTLPERFASVDYDLGDAHQLISNILELHRHQDPGYRQATVLFFSFLLGICDKYNVDEVEVVSEKLAYNRSRPFKHGKKY